jgi:uncharacterized membrane protein YraQ (UPF0718 family)
VLAVALLVVGRTTGWQRSTIDTLSIVFVSIVLEALPFMMLGSLVGGLIEVFLSREWVSGVLSKRRWPAFLLAGLCGVVMPVCECAIIPVTRRLLRKGVPFAVAVAYLLAGPIVNPIVAGSTAVAYAWDWRVVGLRMACGYGIALVAAALMDVLFPGRSALRADKQHDHEHACACGHDHDHAPNGRRWPVWVKLIHALNHAAEDLLFVGQFLVIGAFVAALCQALISRQAFLSLAGAPSLSVLLMMLLAVVLNVCSEADAFVAASFRAHLPLSAQMAFLVLGPMLDLKLAAMYLSFVRKRAFAALAALTCGLVFAVMMLLEVFGWLRSG